MTTLDLPVKTRSSRDSSRKIRSLKQVPGVVYGHGIPTQHVAVEASTFRRVFGEASYSVLLSLDIEGKEKVPVLVHEVQYHPVTSDILHVDFYAVRMDEKLETSIPLKFIGLSEAVRLGAVLNTNKHDVEVSCLPKDLVHEISVDISRLEKLNDAIHVRDLLCPAGITILSSPGDLVVAAQELKVIVEEAPVAEAVSIAEGAAAPGAEGEEAAAGTPAEGEKAEKGDKEKKEGGKEAPAKGEKKAEKKEKK